MAEADAIFKPRGDMVARVEEEVTDSHGVSNSHGTSSGRTSTLGTSSSTAQSHGTSHATSDGRTSNWNGMTGSNNIGFSHSNGYHSGTNWGSSQSTGHTEGTSQQHGESYSRSVKLRRDYYTVDEQSRMHAYAISQLPARHAYVVLGNDRADTYLIRTLDVTVEWQTCWGGKDYKEEFLRLAAPPELIPAPSQPLETRLRVLIERQKRLARQRTSEGGAR